MTEVTEQELTPRQIELRERMAVLRAEAAARAERRAQALAEHERRYGPARVGAAPFFVTPAEAGAQGGGEPLESGIPDQVRDDEQHDFPSPSGEGIEGWGLSDAEDAADRPHPNPSPKGEGLESEPSTLPAITRTPRHNEWTRARMVAFLRKLAASQSVSQAARSVGLSRQSAYKLRNRLAGTPFALAWEVALEAGLQQLAHALMDRALNGEEVPHYYHGELVGTHRKHDNRLAAWLLANPWKVGRHQAAREFAADKWEALLERIEGEGPGWEGDDFVPNPQYEAASREQDEQHLLELIHETSWYADHPLTMPSRTKR